MLAAMWFQASGPAGILGSPIVMMVIVLGIFYVMLILPQQRQRKKMQQMLTALKTGDKVITNSGIYGTCLLYTSPSPRDLSTSRMPSSA